MSAREHVSVRHLSVTYGQGQQTVGAVEDLSFDVAAGEFLCIVGPSGCGKSTLLKAMSGLLDPTSGTIGIAGNPVDGPPKDLALVFQEYTRSLFPWLTVERNIVFPLAAKGVAKSERRRRAADALKRVGLHGVDGMYPWQLSGGMQQRVAISRALAYEPAVLVMDEPFASVDAQTRADLEDLLLEVHQATGLTVIFVTHDIDESVYLGDRVIVLTDKPGRIRQVLDVNLTRPRDQIRSRSEAAFLQLRADIVELIKSERRAPPAIE
jgi:NitT/TauT family transport system ATP-binding protein